MRSRTSWREKLEKPQAPRMVEVASGSKMAARFGAGRMLIPTALAVDAFIRKVPRGRLTTPGDIRRALAEQHGADFTCPLVTGIFIRLAAEAAEEDRAAGKTRVTPYWRVVKDDGSLYPKFPGGTAAQAAHLREEGHHLAPGGCKVLGARAAGAC